MGTYCSVSDSDAELLMDTVSVYVPSLEAPFFCTLAVLLSD